MNDRSLRDLLGRRSKSKGRTANAASPVDDLSTSSSSSSSSSTNHSSPSHQARRSSSRPYRLASPSDPTNKLISPISDDSLSERHDHSSSYRPRGPSTFTNYEEKSPASNSIPRATPPSPPGPSVYLIELSNDHRTSNPYGLTKTVTYVWKNSDTKKGAFDLNSYPRYCIEQVTPVLDHNQRPIPVSSRHVTLQRGQIDYWQNFQPTPDSILTSSCQNHTGSASNLLEPTLETKSTAVRSRSNQFGQIISISSTKRRQPSLLNQSQNTEWNIEADGKQLRYSNLKWYSVDQLQKDPRRLIKPRSKRRNVPMESTTDTGSSSDQYYQSAPPVLQRRSPRSTEKGTVLRSKGNFCRETIPRDLQRVFPLTHENCIRVTSKSRSGSGMQMNHSSLLT